MKLEEKKIQPRSYSNKKEYHSFLKTKTEKYITFILSLCFINFIYS